MFPIGHLHKAQVREIAETHGLATAKRPDSYGICFIGKRKLDMFLPGYIGVTKGAFVDHDTGEVLGTCVSREVGVADGELTQLRLGNGSTGHHQGAELYTIGQKARIAGLDRKYVQGRVCGARGRTDGGACRWFVVGLNVEDGVVKVVDDTHHPAMYCDYIEVRPRTELCLCSPVCVRHV